VGFRAKLEHWWLTEYLGHPVGIRAL
jgi:hypothetical protein